MLPTATLFLKNGEKMKNDYHHKNLKNELIDAGVELISKKGIDSLSLRSLAKQLGVSHTAIYRHFKNKESLVLQIIEHGYTLLHTSLEKAVKESDNIIEQFILSGRYYLKFAIDYPNYYNVMFGKYINKSDYSENLREKSMKPFNLIADIIYKAQQAGYIKKIDHRKAAFVVWSLVHGTANLIITQKIPAEFIEMKFEEIEAVMNSIVAEGLFQSE
jgi:AcrR family transcriptional regulator